MTYVNTLEKLINELQSQLNYIKDVEYAIGEVYSTKECIESHIYSTTCNFIEALEAIRDEQEDYQGAIQYRRHTKIMNELLGE